MVAFDSTQMYIYLIGVFALAALALVLSLGVVARAVVSNRRTRLARRQSVRAYYGGLALHH
jgi:hypothetical protein